MEYCVLKKVLKLGIFQVILRASDCYSEVEWLWEAESRESVMKEAVRIFKKLQNCLWEALRQGLPENAFSLALGLCLMENLMLCMLASGKSENRKSPRKA